MGRLCVGRPKIVKGSHNREAVVSESETWKYYLEGSEDRIKAYEPRQVASRKDKEIDSLTRKRQENRFFNKCFQKEHSPADMLIFAR